MNIQKAIRKILESEDSLIKVIHQATGINSSRVHDIIKENDKPDAREVESISKALGIQKEILIVFAAEEKDVPQDRKEMFREIWPLATEVLSNLIKDKDEEDKSNQNNDQRSEE